MKLNYKRTMLVGFAFMLIMTFWQAYDTIIPKILTDKFGLSQTLSGFIMALDNILALFMLPLFGAISDKCKSPRGKRTPFILIGTIVAAVSFIALSFADLAQLNNLGKVTEFDDKASLETLYYYDYSSDREVQTPAGVVYKVKDFSYEEWTSITSETKYYIPYSVKNSVPKAEDAAAVYDGSQMIYADGTNQDASAIMSSCRIVNPYLEYVVPARQVYAWNQTENNSTPLVVFIVILLLTLIAMSVFRSPAVALMPDVTPKPLRSKANAVICLMGSVGAAAVLALGIVFGTGKVQNQLMSYTLYMAVVSGIMLICLVIFITTVKEPQWSSEMEETEEKETLPDTKRRLTKGEIKSLLLILLSVVLWFMGFNAVSSKYSVYATSVLNMDYNTTIIISQIAGIISYFPIGMLSSAIGRKKVVVASTALLTAVLVAMSFIGASSSPIVMNVLFALSGVCWAAINVNSFPMVVELAKGGDVGKYTGYYYAASMAAQIVTPIFSGYLMDVFGMQILFPYAVVFFVLSLVSIVFVKHGDSKPLPAKAAIESFDIDK